MWTGGFPLPPKKADTIKSEMTQTILRESVMEAPVKKGNRWRVIVAKPGTGSSGKYSAEVLERDAQKMLPPGAQSFFTHDEKRDPRDMVGVYPEGGSWSKEDQAVVAELDVFESWKPLVEQLAPHVGMSLYALGDKDDDDNVTEFFEDLYNGADIVSRPGLKGSGFDQKLYEEARAASEKPSAEPSALKGKETKEMDEAKVAELVGKAVADAIAPLVSAQNAKAEEAAQKDADKAAVSEALEAYDAAVKAIDEADLIPEQVEALRAEAKSGVDVTAKIAEAKAMQEAIVKHITESAESGPAGRVLGEKSETKYGAWK